VSHDPEPGPLIDAHLHQWDLAACDYPWITPAVGILERTHAIDEVEPERAAAGVTGAVLVQAANSRCDTEGMLAAMDAHPWVQGVVGWVDLARGAAVEDEAAELAADPRIVGVRHLNHDEADPDWLVRPDVLEGIRTVARVGLAFDAIAIWPLHLGHVPTLAEAAPELRVVVDHLAKPPIASGDLAAWRAALARAAAYPNVHAKVSGLDTAAGSPDWTPDDLRPAFEAALELFGADRLLYGGDWPVCRLGGGYARQHAAFEALTAPLSPSERAALRAGTAIRVYRLGAATEASDPGA
jgi:L-fuconolactonase